MHSRKEADVGMSEYISTHAGFHGIIKMRYQDFLVHEIDQDGQIVHLTDLKCNIDDAQEEDTKNTPQVQNADVLSSEEKESLASVVSGKETEVVLKAGDSKIRRTEIHKAINRLYPELESSTVDDTETKEKVIKVTKNSNNSRKRAARNIRMPKKSLCKFVLFKQNVGTMEGINMIARRLRLYKANGFQYAGTKDKRAVTTQLVTAPFAAERLCGLNKHDSNIKLGNFSYCKKPLQLGDLKGNHFSIVIRDVNANEEQIKSAFKSFSETGFINYYGSQRFGTTTVPTYSVGIEILKSNWQKVVELLLHPRENNQKNSELNKGLLEYAKSGDSDAALKLLRHKGSVEGALLMGLSKFGKKQAVQAITMIPRNMRKMYVHSYQSYVWNRIASRRFKEFGLKPIPGDQVRSETYRAKTDQSTQEGVENTTSEPPCKRLCASEEADSNQISAGGEQGTEENSAEELQTPKNQDVVSLTEKDLGKFSVSDVLLPLPGHDVVYPNNIVGAWYREVMKSDGMDIDTHMVHKQKDYSLPGDYRNLVVRPTHVEHDTVQYNDYTVPLLLTDLEKLEKKEVPSSIPDGKYTALRIKFSLPTSCYATVALREILKMDISVAAQMELNKHHGSADDSVPAQDEECGTLSV